MMEESSTARSTDTVSTPTAPSHGFMNGRGFPTGTTSDQLWTVLDVVAIQEKLKERIDDVEALVIQSEARDVIFRTELLKRLGQIEARITGLERAEMEQRNAEDKLRPKARQEEFSRVMTGVRELVKGLPEDVEIIKKCLPEIEKRIGLRRKQVEAEQ